MIKKEDLGSLIKELSEKITREYPQVPLVLIAYSNDAQHFARIQTHFLQDPYQAIQALSNNILQINTQLIESQRQLAAMFTNQALAQAMEEAKASPKN
jgi:predicted phage tail protein